MYGSWIRPNLAAFFHDQILPDYVVLKIEETVLNSYRLLTHWLDQPFCSSYTKENTSPGIDNISYNILKHLSTSAFVILWRIINSSWSKSLVPDIWRH